MKIPLPSFSSEPKTDFRLRFSLLAAAAVLLTFTLARVGIWLGNAGYFAELSGAEILRAFVQGLRFDFYITALFFGPVLLLLNLPVKSPRWVKFWTGFCVIEWVFLTGFLIGDWIYFSKVHRHVADEIIQVSNDWGFVVSYIFTQVLLPLIVLLTFLAFVLTLLCRYTDARYRARAWTWWRSAGLILLMGLLILAGLRGHLGGGKSLGVADVYKYAVTAPAAALTLNGAFTAYQVGRKGALDINNTFPVEQAIENTQKLLIAADEKIPRPAYGLMRQKAPAAKPAKRPNIFIILLEGWHPYYVDGLSHQNFGVTPVFDRLLKEGVNFTNAYAAGQRSIFGFAAVLAGLPLVPGLPMFGYGLELTELYPMPKMFADNGYYTFFAQTSQRDSYRLCALASYLGMQESYGWEDIPELLPYKERAPFGYDYDALLFAADKIALHRDKPFFGMVFTGITHEPFTSTLPEFDKYPYDTWEHGFLNTLAFADWSIGQFLERAKKDGWFDDTIFVLVADHTSGGPADNSLKNHFQIPLVLYAPKLLPAREEPQVVSQLDVVPTLQNLAGLTPVYTAFGRDMLDTSAPRAALVSEGSTLGLITAQGALRHNGNSVLDAEPYTADFDTPAAETLLLSLHQAALTLLKENRWYRTEEPL